MRLTGALSNRGRSDVIEALVHRKHKVELAIENVGLPRQAIRLPQGAVQAAVRKVLGLAPGALRIAEIQAQAEQELGRTVSRDTVGSFLSVACRATAPTVVRVGHGSYRSSHPPA
jgi:hypothetical protein